MTEIVYYAYANDVTNQHSMLYGQEPLPVKNEYIKGKDVEELRFMKCPAFLDEVKNVYQINNQYNVDFDVKDDGLSSSVLPQDFFDTMFHTHSVKEKVYALKQNVVFIAKSDSLEISQQHANFSEESWHSNTITIPGKMDIGAYPRELNFAFHIKNGTDKLSLNEGDPLYYIKFHTTNKIKFVPFFWTPKFTEIKKNLKFHGTPFHKFKPLQFYYDVVKKKNIKKLIMKEIKNNLMN
jgi:hypothetical protein